MNEVQFQEDIFTRKGVLNKEAEEEKESKSVNFLIDKEIVKDKKQANILLISCALIFLAISALIFFKNTEVEPDVVPYQKLEQNEKNKIPEDERIFIEQNIKNI